jgi:hypothetical protein
VLRFAPIPLLAAAAAALACASAGTPGASRPEAADAAAARQSFEPGKGITCHRDTKVCERKGQPSVGLTRLIFGDGPADAVSEGMAASHYPGDPIFKPTPWESCDTLVTTCYGADGASAELTARYFSSEAARRLQRRQSEPAHGITRRGATITCDHAAGVCYDRLGADVGATRMYLGEDKSAALIPRLRGF